MLINGSSTGQGTGERHPQGLKDEPIGQVVGDQLRLATARDGRLFGHEKRAFTGPSASAGRFEQANGDFLFLDEVGDLDIELQAKLLRGRSVGRVGGNEVIKIDDADVRDESS